MPELPEVATIVNHLRPSLAGRQITATTVFWDNITRPIPAMVFIKAVTGKKIIEIDRCGKNILISLDSGCIHIHLRMTGRLYIIPKNEMSDSDKWLRVNLILDDEHELHFSDSRKLGSCTYSESPPASFTNLGPEPQSAVFSPEHLFGKVSGRRSTIKSIIMDQRVLAGVGNIYADESLWKARISPQTPGNSLSLEQVTMLYQCINETISEAIEREGATIDWYRKPDGKPGTMQDYFNVYGRQKLPCPRCGNPVVKIRLGGRGTHFCPHCQS